MYTLPEWRGRGLAKAILGRLVALAREKGVGRIWLHATAAGRLLYEKAGFRPKVTEVELCLGDAGNEP